LQLSFLPSLACRSAEHTPGDPADKRNRTCAWPSFDRFVQRNLHDASKPPQFVLHECNKA